MLMFCWQGRGGGANGGQEADGEGVGGEDGLFVNESTCVSVCLRVEEGLLC